MARIHGLAYLLIGILIASSSYYIDKNIREGFTLFIYAGLLMIIIGIIKLAVLWAKNRKEKKPAHHHTTHHHAQHTQHHTRHTSQQHTQPHTHHQTRQHQQTTYCPRCGAALSSRANFCYNCGNRIE